VRSEPVATINLLLKLSSLEGSLVMATVSESNADLAIRWNRVRDGRADPATADRQPSRARWQIVTRRALEAAQNRNMQTWDSLMRAY
jgi:hypothetical protein